MRIDDPAFQDFREDASCIIRPQALLARTLRRVPEHRAAGPGHRAPAGDCEARGRRVGEGQYLLPLEHNGKAVDLDLVNNIMREPYPDRFRLILNDLGASVSPRVATTSRS